MKPEHGSVHLIASSSDKFQSFSVGDMLFVDSLMFLQGRLEDLAKDVLRDQRDWNYTREAILHDSRLEKFMKMKLPFPYTYFDS